MRRIATVIALAVGALLLGCAGLYGYGATLVATHTATQERLLSAPADEVWELIADPLAAPRWRPDVSAVQALGEGRFREEGAEPLTIEVRHAERPHRYEAAIVDNPTFGGTWTWELQPEGQGTRVRVTERGEVYDPLARVFFTWFMDPEATMRDQLDALQAHLAK
ncbi:MAG: SRPBCC family protein [Myxococcales bacterium]|nr:SRPBCC family protein [Myxococcales bacterium]